MDTALPPVGRVLRSARRRAGVSQLELSSRTGISTRHLSRVETGLAEPSRELLERLADALDLTAEPRDDLVRSAGFGVPARSSRPFDLRPFQELVDALAPIPALVMDETWTLVVANRPAHAIMSLAASALRTPPVNLLRLTLHPEGLLPHLADADRVRGELAARVGRQRALTADRRLDALAAELQLDEASPTEESPGFPMRFITALGVIEVRATATVPASRTHPLTRTSRSNSSHPPTRTRRRASPRWPEAPRYQSGLSSPSGCGARDQPSRTPGTSNGAGSTRIGPHTVCMRWPRSVSSPPPSRGVRGSPRAASSSNAVRASERRASDP